MGKCIGEEASVAPLALVVTVNQLLGGELWKMAVLDEVGALYG